MDPLSDLEEQKTLILLGMVGAIVAEPARQRLSARFGNPPQLSALKQKRPR